VLSGAWASGESTDYPAAPQERFIAELEQLAPHAEVVVVDAGGSRGAFARRLWHAAGAALVVTTIDDASIMQCYAAIKVLAAGDSPVPVYTLANLAPDAGTAAEPQARVAEACRRFLGLRVTPGVSVPPCETLPATGPVLVFPPRGDAARSMDRMADILWAQLHLAAARDATARRATTASS
jgi:MinD-like ATPase involved in chromosome partitioning or flagellar assembly